MDTVDGRREGEMETVWTQPFVISAHASTILGIQRSFKSLRLILLVFGTE